MRVLVTGAAGFVGRHLVDAFEARGDEVHGIDLVPSGRSSVVVDDALDFFRGVRAPTGFDLAVHCAATIGGRTGIDGTPLAVATNLALDAWYFRWLEQARIPRAVYFSSSAAYPVNLQNDFATARELREDDIRLGAYNIGRPDATYGWAKLTGEQLAAIARARGQRVLVVRPFSGYGPDQSVDYPFPALIRRAFATEPGGVLDVWGDGRSVRDWIHIDDIVRAVLALLDANEDGPVNLGTGVPTSFEELAGEMLRAAHGPNHDRTVRFLTDKPTGVAYRLADPTKMRAFYRPKWSIADGIRQAMAGAAFQTVQAGLRS